MLAMSTARRREQFIIRDKYQIIQITKSPLKLESLYK